MTPPQDLRARHLIGAAELAHRIAAGDRIVSLDIRFRPDRPDGRPAYRAGHIPGAVYVDLPTELAGETAGFSGRRPLPAIRDLQRDARRWGLRDGDPIVVYDDNRGLQAARAWWVLRWAGLTSVRLLDGGLAAWTRAGGVLTTDIPLPDLGNVTLKAGNLPAIDADGAAEFARDHILLDARNVDAYLGRPAEKDVPREGHIPGAHNLPTTGNLADDGTFAAPAEIRARLESAGVASGARIGVYCGGGVAASHQILAFATAGIEASLFPGSWSAWSSDPDRPVATGVLPG